MFEKYNEKARRALFFARYEASKLGSRVIESEHILLGILREGEESVGELFQQVKHVVGNAVGPRAHDQPNDLGMAERLFVDGLELVDLDAAETAEPQRAGCRGDEGA